MFDIMQIGGLTFQVLRRLKWFFVACAYMMLFATLGAKALLVVLPCFAMSACAYMGDKARETQSMDDFSAGRLFFRYGHQVDSTAIPIPIDRKWGFEETQSYAQTLRFSLAQLIAARLPASLVQVLGNVVVVDRGTGERKEFLRVRVR